MKIRKALIKYASPAALGLLAFQVYAAVPADVDTAMTDMKTDALKVATGFLIACICLAAFKMMKRGAS